MLLNVITELQKIGMTVSFSCLNYAQSSQEISVSWAVGAFWVH
ncbi:hypothetical protein DBR06_SOUSAS32310006, partial [Sousa chinensis]